MRSVEVRVTGVTPLIVNRFHEEAQESATTGVRSRKEHDEPLEDARKRLYVDSVGKPYFPAENLRQSIIVAAAGTKVGRRSAQRDAAAALYLEPYALLIDPPSWEVDARPVVNPSTKGRIVRYRPIFNTWSIGFTLNVETNLIDLRTMRKIVDDAGNYVGIGDFRPTRKGPYGRFRVDEWSEGEATA